MNSQGHVISIQNAYQNHLYRQQGLALCKTLISLIVELQKHRGCTMAILSGDHFFETQLFGIQRDITEILQAIDEKRNNLLQLSEPQQIQREWISIRRQWHKDTVQENFLLHSNLISEISKSVWHVVERSNQVSISQTHDQLLSLGLRDWLQMMELAAQARGLATHIAVCKEGDPNLVSRLKFLNTQMAELNQDLQQMDDRLEEAFIHPIRKALESSEYDSHLEAFQSAISTNFVESDQYMDADTIYTCGSHVVSSSHQVLLACIRMVEQVLSPELEAWILG